MFPNNHAMDGNQSLVMQQNWNQWQAYQQQLAQWQAQYGEQYQREMLQKVNFNQVPGYAQGGFPIPMAVVPGLPSMQTVHQLPPLPMNHQVAPPLPPSHQPAPPPMAHPAPPPPPPEQENTSIPVQLQQQLFSHPPVNPIHNLGQTQPPHPSNSNRGDQQYHLTRGQPPSLMNMPSRDEQHQQNLSAVPPSVEEIAFDEQFKKWEAEFDNWKRLNVDHPDKVAYMEYETKMEQCRTKLLERREQMRQRKFQMLAKEAPSSSQPQQPIENSAFLTANDNAGIPGLDLIEEEKKRNQELKLAQDSIPIDGDDPTNTENHQNSNNLEAISKGINNILGDPALLNMLSNINQRGNGSNINQRGNGSNTNQRGNDNNSNQQMLANEQEDEEYYDQSGDNYYDEYAGDDDSNQYEGDDQYNEYDGNNQQGGNNQYDDQNQYEDDNQYNNDDQDDNMDPYPCDDQDGEEFQQQFNENRYDDGMHQDVMPDNRYGGYDAHNNRPNNGPPQNNLQNQGPSQNNRQNQGKRQRQNQSQNNGQSFGNTQIHGPNRGPPQKRQNQGPPPNQGQMQDNSINQYNGPPHPDRNNIQTFDKRPTNVPNDQPERRPIVPPFEPRHQSDIQMNHPDRRPEFENRPRVSDFDHRTMGTDFDHRPMGTDFDHRPIVPAFDHRHKRSSENDNIFKVRQVINYGNGAPAMKTGPKKVFDYSHSSNPVFFKTKRFVEYGHLSNKPAPFTPYIPPMRPRAPPPMNMMMRPNYAPAPMIPLMEMPHNRDGLMHTTQIVRPPQPSKREIIQNARTALTTVTTTETPFNRPNIVKIEDILYEPGRKTRPQKILIVMRGPPGSGKSHLAKKIKDVEHAQFKTSVRILSIDDYFTSDSEDVVESSETKDTNKVAETSTGYKYDKDKEQTYAGYLMKLLKKTITDGLFEFIIVDAVNASLAYCSEIQTFAKQQGFTPYTCELLPSASTCFERNIHGRTLPEVEEIIRTWQPIPDNYLTLGVDDFIVTSENRERVGT